MTGHDVLIVGAGVGGAALALALGRTCGARVLLVDRRGGPGNINRGDSLLPFLSLIRQPTLVVAGDDDPIIPTVNARLLARGIPRARLHLYGGGHLALVTEADELAPVVDAFLDEG